MSSIVGLLSNLELSESHSEPTQNATKSLEPSSQAATLALHREIEAFYTDIHGNGVELAKRQEAIQRASAVLTAANPNIQVMVFGSTLTGLFLRSSDIDLVVNMLDASHFSFNAAGSLRKFLEQLRQGLGVRDIEMVAHAIVPVLKVTDVKSGIELDISCAKSTEPNPGVQNSTWIKQTIQGHPNLPKLLVVVKEILHRRGIPDVHSGGISSYALTLMTISFLQLHAQPTDNLGDLLLKFLKVYGKDFNYNSSTIIITGGGQVIDKCIARGRFCEMPSQTLSIQDPVNPRKDVGRPSFRGALRVKGVFGRAYEALQMKINQSVAGGGASIGSYLQAVFEAKY